MSHSGSYPAHFWHVVSEKAGVDLRPWGWAVPHGIGEVGMPGLAAILRHLPAPASRDLVETAFILVMVPSLVVSMLPDKHRWAWRSLTGSRDMAIESITALPVHWGSLLRRAVIERVLRKDDDGLWRAGEDVNDAPSPVFDARALVVLTVLGQLPALRACLLPASV